MATHVEVAPALLRWACERSRVPDLQVRFPKLAAWQTGDAHPTFKQLEAFAKATHVPFGYLFLPEPPDEPLPIADFRERSPGPPSGELLDTIYAAQRRQDWFKEYATTERLSAIDWVGCATRQEAPREVAARLRKLLDFEVHARKEHANWEAATKALVDRVQALGVLVSVSGIAGTNTRRKLEPAEFRGFSLVDALAPFIFINGADHKAAHAFTLCHELAHLALGSAGLSNEDLGEFRHEQVEIWCDAVASEILVPSDHMSIQRGETDVPHVTAAITHELRVSPLIAVRRVAELSERPEKTLARWYQPALNSLPAQQGGSGGNFYATALKRIGHRFARDVIASTLEGNTTYSEAFRLLGIRNSVAFGELSRRVGLST